MSHILALSDVSNKMLKMDSFSSLHQYRDFTIYSAIPLHLGTRLLLICTITKHTVTCVFVREPLAAFPTISLELKE